jgi:hypothetical protein
MLSAHERRQLRDIEQQLRSDAPDLARALTGEPATRKHGSHNAAILLAVLALVLIVLGIMTAGFPLLFLGSITAMTATCLYCTKRTPK